MQYKFVKVFVIEINFLKYFGEKHNSNLDGNTQSFYDHGHMSVHNFAVFDFKDLF